MPPPASLPPPGAFPPSTVRQLRGPMALVSMPAWVIPVGVGTILFILVFRRLFCTTSGRSRLWMHRWLRRRPPPPLAPRLFPLSDEVLAAAAARAAEMRAAGAAPIAKLPERFDPAQLRVVPNPPDAADTMCAICLDPLSSRRVTVGACGHHIHRACMYNWLVRDTMSSCPICRAHFELPDPPVGELVRGRSSRRGGLSRISSARLSAALLASPGLRARFSSARITSTPGGPRASSSSRSLAALIGGAQGLGGRYAGELTQPQRAGSGRLGLQSSTAPDFSDGRFAATFEENDEMGALSLESEIAAAFDEDPDNAMQFSHSISLELAAAEAAATIAEPPSVASVHLVRRGNNL